MQVIGITGGVGCGKSTVLAYLIEKYHVQAVQADVVARKLQEKGQKVFLDIVEAFGRSILDEAGELDRSALAEIVFHDEAKRKFLNGIVHPAVKRRILQDIEEAKAAGCQWFFIEAALLIESGYGEICQELWYVDADPAARASRLKASRGYSQERFERMSASQLDRQTFLQHCQVVIHNDGTEEEMKAAVDAQMRRLASAGEHVR